MTTLATLAFEFEDTDIPAVTRTVTAAPNPYREIVNTLKDNLNTEGFRQARTLRVPVLATGKEEDDKTDKRNVEKIVRQLREVGDSAAPQFSVRTKVDPEDKGPQVTEVTVDGKPRKVKVLPVVFWVHAEEKDENGTKTRVPSRITRTAKS